MVVKLLWDKNLFFFPDWVSIKPCVSHSVRVHCRVLRYSHWLVPPLRTRALWPAWLAVAQILRSTPWHRVLVCLNGNLSSCRGVDVLVLGDFPENELVRVVLDIELIRFYNGFDHKSFFDHGVVFLESFQLFFVNWSDIDTSDFLPV